MRFVAVRKFPKFRPNIYAVECIHAVIVAKRFHRLLKRIFRIKGE
jgi:hypothetical protein